MSVDWNRAPEGATHWDPVDENWLRQFNEVALGWLSGKGWSRKGWQYPDDLSIMPRLIARPAWSGEGLPPAGTVCDYRAEGWPRDQWEVRTVMYVSEHHVITKEECGIERRVDGGKAVFRPIRTAEQIAADERMACAKECHSLIFPDGKWYKLDELAKEAWCSIYDAGYRKQVIE